MLKFLNGGVLLVYPIYLLGGGTKTIDNVGEITCQNGWAMVKCPRLASVKSNHMETDGGSASLNDLPKDLPSNDQNLWQYQIDQAWIFLNPGLKMRGTLSREN